MQASAHFPSHKGPCLRFTHYVGVSVLTTQHCCWCKSGHTLYIEGVAVALALHCTVTNYQALEV